MENFGGFASWAPPALSSPYSSSSSPIAAAAAASSPSSCFLFPDQLVVPAIGTASSGAHQFHYHHQQQPQLQQKAQQPHLTCLKLGKRQYYGGGGGAEAGAVVGGPVKRERASVTSSMATTPRCQVEGCNKALVDAKDYHRRHKVCEAHSKAPKVVVLGSEQRFCQQCSRFHAISEFDDSKRSCRRRLAGHNERRRKSNGGDSIIRNPTSTATALQTTIMGSRFPYLSQTGPGRALSLLSSKSSPWIPTPELSSRSSAALRELIAENRAALLARQLVSNNGWHSVGYSNQSIISFASPENQEASRGTAQLLNGWDQFQESGSQLTLDLMQSLNSTSFELLSGRNNKSKEDDEDECCEIWKSLQGTHVV